MRWSLFVLAAIPALAALPACNDCDFTSRCNGTIREVCGEGEDQLVGREVHSFPCEAPNGACVEVERRAFCVVEPIAPCDARTFVPSCSGEALLQCPSDVAHVLAEDCASIGQTCDLRSGRAACETPL